MKRIFPGLARLAIVLAVLLGTSAIAVAGNPSCRWHAGNCKKAAPGNAAQCFDSQRLADCDKTCVYTTPRGGTYSVRNCTPQKG